jgi:hypothetical protein
MVSATLSHQLSMWLVSIDAILISTHVADRAYAGPEKQMGKLISFPNLSQNKTSLLTASGKDFPIRFADRRRKDEIF